MADLTPITREEMWLDEIANAVSGGGGGGTSDYTELSNKPKINNVELSGNKSSSDLNLRGTSDKIDGADIDALTGYEPATTAAPISENDSLNTALGKIEKRTGDVENDILNLNDMTKDVVSALNFGTLTRTLTATFKMGYVHGVSYNTPTASNNTAYSTLFETISKVRVKPKSGYKCLIAYVKADKTCAQWSEFSTGETIVTPPTPYFCVELRKADNSNFNVANLPEDVISLEDYVGTALPKELCFVQSDGNDDNDGLSRSAPFATIQRAIDLGFKNIYVKEGVYTSGITFSGVKTSITICRDKYYDTYSAGTNEDNPKIIIDGTTNNLSRGVSVIGGIDCTICDIEVRNTSSAGFYIEKGSNHRFKDCIAHDIGVGATSGTVGGFIITSSDADFYNCECYNIGTNTTGTGTYHFDGFNIHGTGVTNFINCKAWNCEDDGISHHDACCGMIDGGEWYGCGKAGVASPTHGAKVNVSNVYCHDNSYGIYAGNDNAVTDRGNMIFSNCVCKNNSNKDMYVNNYYKVIAINCVYDTITGDSNVTRYGIT